MPGGLDVGLAVEGLVEWSSSHLGRTIAHSTGAATNPQEDVKMWKMTFDLCVLNPFNSDQ